MSGWDDNGLAGVLFLTAVLGYIMLTILILPAIVKYVDFSLGTWRRWIADWKQHGEKRPSPGAERQK